MRPRLIRRILARQLKLPNKAPKAIRTFTQNSPALYNARPQLPFLSIPSHLRHRQQWRYLTTERKTWLKREAILGIKYTGYLWAILACAASAAFAVQQELAERRFPTPHEWSFRTRMLKRAAEAERNRTDVFTEDWVLIIQILTDVVARLEDPDVDGRGGLADVLGPPGSSPPGSKDVAAMPEPWRRGYFEALLLQARAAEHVEGWVLDTRTSVVFAPDVVRGPSNPSPRPIPPGSAPAPREEDCVPAGYPSPDRCYLKLLSTGGLTSRQRMDAALAYANWLEHKGLLGPAAVMYDEAVSMAVGEEQARAPGAPPPVDPQTAVLAGAPPPAPPPSANLLRTLTALAAFRARHEDPSAALPVMVSILKARRSLPRQPSPGGTNSQADNVAAALRGPPGRINNNNNNNNNNDNDNDSKRYPLEPVLSLLRPPAYPPPPPDGTAPPARDSRELCEEAALHLHIGEIMYTLRGGGQKEAREGGLAWTREGVDLAEEELHRVLLQQQQGGGGRGSGNGNGSGNDNDNAAAAAKKTCRECLASGLDNWAAMVGRMARDERAARAAETARGASSGTASAGWWWFGPGLWSRGKAVPAGEVEHEDGNNNDNDDNDVGGRWAAEQKVVAERTVRAQPMLEDLQKPPSALWSSFLKA